MSIYSERHSVVALFWLFSLLPIVLLYPALALGQACVPPPPGVVAWWPFNETSGTLARDIAGAHDGVYVGTPARIPGLVAGALRFDGTGAFGSGPYVEVADSDVWAFGATDFTIEMWVNFDTPGGGEIHHPSHILIGQDEGPGFRNKWFFALGGGFLYFHVNTSAGGDEFLPLAQFSPTVGRWYHLAVIRTGSTLTIFIDGLAAASATLITPIPNANAPLTIGQAENLGFMNGRLDEVTVYNRALVQSELQVIVDAGSAGKCINLEIRPNKGGDTGTVSVHINGTAFAHGATVKLTSTGQPDIGGSPVTVNADGTGIDTVFDLTGKTRGVWDVVVTNPGGAFFTLPAGFVIEQGISPQLWVDIAGLPVFRAGTPATYWISFGNDGNVDVASSTLLISLPTGLRFETDLPGLDGHTPTTTLIGSGDRDILGINVSGLKRSSNDPIRLTVRPDLGAPSTFSIAAYIRADPLTPIVLPPVPIAQQGGRITQIVFRFPDTFEPGDSGHVEFLTSDGRTIGWEGERQGDVIRDFIRQAPYDPHALPYVFTIPGITDDQARDLYNRATTLLDVPMIYDNLDPKNIFAGRGACTGFVERLLEVVGYNGGEGLVRDFLPLGLDLSIGRMYETLRSSPDNGNPNAPPYPFWRLFVSESLGVVEQAREDFAWLKKTLERISSWDPNAKAGPEGFSDQRFVTDNRSFQYVVSFENMASATAAAQTVTITDQLDTATMDLSTLTLGPITFGKTVVNVPTGRSSFATVVDLRPTTNLLARIVSSLNPNTGLLTWHFTSIDPATGNLPTDPRVGFLPPNVNPPEGDGSVLFTVQPKQGLATSTKIRNRASIVFDTNAPIQTPEWVNTIDNTKPLSHVLPLAPRQPAPSFTVAWSGTDPGAGIKDFTIFVSDNGGPFIPFVSNSVAASAIYTGANGHTYAFFSQVRDLVGNVEALKGQADTTTQVVADMVPPTTIATPTARANDITVVLAAQDNSGGSGVRQLTYSLSGAQSGGAVVPGSNASVVISAKGQTTLSYFAIDNAGNQETPKTLTVQIASAGNTTCTGPTTGILHNVVVPDGTSCVLSGVTVSGNVEVKSKASLSVGPLGASAIRGNVEADHCGAVMLSGAVTVGGNVNIHHCSIKSGYAGPGVRVDGNFECHDNSGACLADNGSVGGNVQVNQNKSASASDISANTIGGNLQCQGNTPAPTHTGSNIARKKDGQCAASLGF